MIKIDYPVHEFRIRNDGGRQMIFDEMRHTWLALTPEEWVRQNFVRYLTEVKEYPAALIAMERKIMVGEMLKRFDVLVFGNDHRPWMMVECKSMDVALSEEVLHQILRYNSGVPVPYLVITNGTYCMAFKKQDRQLVPLLSLPEFEK